MDTTEDWILTTPAKHQLFYNSFDPWMKAASKKPDLPQSGVYKLKTDQPIHRFLGTDLHGTLYIGKGIILADNNRIGKFVNALNDTKSRHDGGFRFDAHAQSKYPIERFTIEITLMVNPEAEERRLLQNYRTDFGELPPLNRTMP